MTALIERHDWIPACAGMTAREMTALLNLIKVCVGSIEKVATRLVIPAKAGIQESFVALSVLAKI